MNDLANAARILARDSKLPPQAPIPTYTAETLAQLRGDARYEPNAIALWFQTRGGGGGSSRKANEKEPVVVRVTRDDGKQWIQISTATGFRRTGSWVRRENVKPLLRLEESAIPGIRRSRVHGILYEAIESAHAAGRIVIFRNDKPIHVVTTWAEADIWFTCEALNVRRD